MTSRFISASERSAALTHGAALCGRLMHSTGPAGQALADWQDWARAWGPVMEEQAATMQRKAFNLCLNITDWS